MSRNDLPEEIRLSNGVPVLLQNYEGSVAACYWWNKVGSADEVGPEAGFAHFLEHMLFKDAGAKETGSPSEGKLARAIESLGGDINAYTSFDQTVYHVTCAENHWEKVFSSFASMAKPQKFLKSDFDREREVILEELRKNDDSPGRQLFEHLFEATFKRHPYGRPVIGYLKTLKAAKVGRLERFYRKHYCSGNMGLILVGPYDDARKKRVLALAERHFGKKTYAKKPYHRSARVSEPDLRAGEEIAVVPFDVKTPSLAFAFRVPHLKHDDVPALDLLSGILGNGEASRLYQRLFYRLSIVTEVSGGLYIPNDAGMFYVQLEVDSMEKIEPALKAALEEMNRVRDELPTQEEMERVIVNVESEKLYSTQTADGLASRLGNLRFSLGDLAFDREYIDRLKRVSPRDVAEAAGKYFDPRRMSLVLMVPKDQAASKDQSARHAKGLKGIVRASLARPKAPGAAKKGPKAPTSGFRSAPVESFVTESGIKVALVERPNSPVASVYASALAGVRLERIPGVSHAVGQTWTKGTSRRDSRAISAFIEGKAASIDGFSGKNSAGLQFTGLARDWTALSGLFAEVLTDATFPETEVEHTRRVTEDQLRSIEDHSGQLCSKLFLETLFESHPYGRIAIGTMESLARIDRAALQSAYRDLFNPEQITIGVSGPVDRVALAEWIDELDEKIASLSKSASKTDARAASGLVRPEADLKAPRWAEKSFGREQTHIIVGGLGVDQHSEDRFALRVLQNILGGQSGRLFIELREKKSLAYTVSPLLFEGMERGYVGTYIACARDKKDEAIQGMRQVLERLAQKGPTAQELSRAREYYLGQRAMELQSDSSLAAHYGLQLLYGFEPEDEIKSLERVKSVNAGEIRAVIEKYFLKPHQVTVAVG